MTKDPEAVTREVLTFVTALADALLAEESRTPPVLACVGYAPWQPTPDAEIVDVWDKYDFPICGLYRLGDDLVFFTVLTVARDFTAGSERSLWGYVLIPPDQREAVSDPRFDTEAEFDAFINGLFTGSEDRQACARAVDFVITEILDLKVPPPVR